MENFVNREHLYDLLDRKELKKIKKTLSELHPADITLIINDSPSEYQLPIFLSLSTQTASDVLLELHSEVKENITNNLARTKLLGIIDQMDSDEQVDLIAELDEDKKNEILNNILDKEDKKIIKEFLTYNEDSAGGLMKSEVISVNQKFTVSQVIEFIGKNYEEVENLYYIFVVDDKNHLIGHVNLAKLIVAKKSRSVGEIVEKDNFSAHVNMDQEKVAHIFRKYDIYSLPVVDDNGILRGRITVDDIIDVIDEEASEDVYKMVGLENEDKVFTSPFNSVRKRLPWLSLNLLTAFLVSSIVGIFEQTISQLSYLAVLMPIVAGLGGNSGTQTLTVIVRGIALGDLTIHNTYKAIVKELTVGIINGFIIGSFAMIVAFLFKKILCLELFLESL